MQDFLGTFIGEPFNWGGMYLAVYLALPITTTAVWAVLRRNLSKRLVVTFATFASATIFNFLYCLAWGVQSTISIGFMFTLFVYLPLSVATVLTIRAVQSVLLSLHGRNI